MGILLKTWWIIRKSAQKRLRRLLNKYADSKRGTKRSVSIGGEQNMNEKHELEKYLNMLTEAVKKSL